MRLGLTPLGMRLGLTPLSGISASASAWSRSLLVF